MLPGCGVETEFSLLCPPGFRDGRRDFLLELFLPAISGFQRVAMLQIVSFSREIVLLGRGGVKGSSSLGCSWSC